VKSRLRDLCFRVNIVSTKLRGYLIRLLSSDAAQTGDSSRHADFPGLIRVGERIGDLSLVESFRNVSKNGMRMARTKSGSNILTN
jgi:hypothetical protein